MGSEVDCSGVSRAVWLVKVPKYLSNSCMENTDASGIVGSLQITNSNPQRNEVVFNLSDVLANKEDKDQDIKVPRDYKMVLSKVEKSMGMFSEGSPDHSKVFSFSSTVASATEEEEKGDKLCEFLFINLIVVWKMLSILILQKFL
ncbi:unnamed protein product [Porites lobata]|uniref:TFIIF beta subunit N-terminal domain-containing protein n=1 Tax=Porites lobata TaxID=104759 RepID=A0ABN8NHQ7_9CNID|nr:unnamed protein product [Porites lobata]